MKARLIERLIIIVLKLLIPYLKRKATQTETRADDIIVKMLLDLTKPLAGETQNGEKKK